MVLFCYYWDWQTHSPFTLIFFFFIHLVFHERKTLIGLGRHEGEQLLPELTIFRFLLQKILTKKVIFAFILVFFSHKNYSCSLAKLGHWWYMDCFTNVLTTFLGLGTFQLHFHLCRVRELSDFIKNILICVPKMNRGLMSLERHEGE